MNAETPASYDNHGEQVAPNSYNNFFAQQQQQQQPPPPPQQQQQLQPQQQHYQHQNQVQHPIYGALTSNDLAQYSSHNSFGSAHNTNFSFNNQIAHSPSAYPPPEHAYRRYSNNSNNEKIGFLHSSFTAPRASLLTSKLAKVQKNSKINSSSPNDKGVVDDAKSNYPYPNPRALSHSNLNIKGIATNNNNSNSQRVPPVVNSAASFSSSYNKFNKGRPEGSQFYSTHSDARSFMAYNAPSAISSSYSSAPVSLGKSNGFVPIQADQSSFNSFQPHSIAAPGADTNNYSAFHFHKPTPAVATTNISMETVSSNIQHLHNNASSSSTINVPQSKKHVSNENNNDSLNRDNYNSVPNIPFNDRVSVSSSTHLKKIDNEPFNAAKEIYDPLIHSSTHQGITVDSRGDEHLNIVEYPPQELLLMLSSLLQKIIDANDTLHPDHYSQASQLHQSNKYTVNVLAFHGKNVPAIPIYNYFLRILKYCPMTNEVFLSLLVYFDRIAKRTNAATNGEALQQQQQQQQDISKVGSLNSSSPGSSAAGFSKPSSSSQLFVMDSYNIHRLIIAGITVSSKFFSDVFYKNARYARVGGLPLDELNHIELQFILLTDFKLLIQPDELQRYADLLLKFWRREKAKSTASNSSGSRQLSPPAVDQQMTQ